MYKKLWLSHWIVLFALFLAGCATGPYQGEGKTKSDALLKQQLEAADQQRASKPEGRIIFAGFAMHSQSRAFRGDVLLAEKSVLAIDPNAIVLKLSNPAFGQDADWPYATTQNMEQVLKKVSALARDNDKAVILMTTHGNVDVLSVNFSTQYYPHVNARVLNDWLKDLRGKQTLLLLSACYSGSFLPAVGGPSRIVLTASAKDRSSFGCQFHSTNTYFMDALLNQAELTSFSLEQLMAQAQKTVDQKERNQKLSPPSLPQISIGTAAKVWSNQALKDWVVQ